MANERIRLHKTPAYNMTQSEQATIQDLLDELEDMLEGAARVPLSGGKCMIDGTEAKQIIAELREAIPSEVGQAKAIVADRAQILDSAQKEADSLMKLTEDKVRSMVSQHEITRQAQAQANELLTATKEQVQMMRTASNNYVEDLMKRTESVLQETLQELQQTHQSFEKNK